MLIEDDHSLHSTCRYPSDCRTRYWSLSAKKQTCSNFGAGFTRFMLEYNTSTRDIIEPFMPVLYWLGTDVSRQIVPKGEQPIAPHHYAIATPSTY
jgi:hypothetical protein